MTALHDDQRDPALSALLQANVDAPPLRPGFHDELEARLQSATAAGTAVTTVPARRRRVRPLRLLAAASVAAAAAIFVFAVLPALRGGDTATAGDVLAAMTAASGGAQTVRLHVVSTIVVTGEGDAPEDRSTERGGPHPEHRRRQPRPGGVHLDLEGRRRRAALRDLLPHDRLRPEASRVARVP